MQRELSVSLIEWVTEGGCHRSDYLSHVVQYPCALYAFLFNALTRTRTALVASGNGVVVVVVQPVCR